jgi:TfoX/Sxy family transcriptional regulator of competence genes
VTWEKSAPELVERFGHVLDRFPDVERRKMFGHPAAFVGGNMVTGLHQANWIVRLPDDAQAEAMAEGATTFDPMGGRPMKNYVALPTDVLADDERLERWVERAIEHGRTLPPKAKR